VVKRKFGKASARTNLSGFYEENVKITGKSLISGGQDFRHPPVTMIAMGLTTCCLPNQ